MEVGIKQNDNNNDSNSDKEFDKNGEVSYKITLADLKKEKKSKPPSDDDYKITLEDLEPKKRKLNDQSTKGERVKDVHIPTGEIEVCACSAFHHTCGKQKTASTNSSPKSADRGSSDVPAKTEDSEEKEPTTKKTDSPAVAPAADLTLDGHFLFEGDAGENRPGVPCPQCPFLAKTPKGLAKHMHIHRKEAEGPFNCTVCKYQGKSKVYLARHMLLHDDAAGGASAPALSCEHCPYTTRHPASMTRHRNSHEDQSELRKFRCGKCDYRAKRKDHLERHMFTHLRKDNEVLIP